MRSVVDPITNKAEEGSAGLGLGAEVDLSAQAADEDFLEKIPIAFARRFELLGLAGGEGAMAVAIGKPGSMDQLEVVSRHLGKQTRPVLADRVQLMAAINRAYGQRDVGSEGVLEGVDREQVLAELSQISGQAEDLLDTEGRAPIIRCVNLILFEAVKQQVSDVHIQPYKDRVVVRMRLDGVLYNAFELPKTVQEEVVSRVKVMAGMDIAEKRLPQDGRTTVQLGERQIDLRVATLPAQFGERVVIRLLDKSARLHRLNELGIAPETQEDLRKLLGLEHGLVLVTGPTGSGKSTTLYACLLELNGLEKNILTLEDPIEYQVEGISQTQVSLKKGLTFAGGLRSVLRQDPDIIMVGEVRDQETAAMAIQSALTGHLIFSTLHTNDAASTITRLLELGIEPYLAASSVVGVLAQRLVRRVCPECARRAAPTPEEFLRLGIQGDLKDSIDWGRARRGLGCGHCRNTGYRGRVSIAEMLIPNNAIRQLIAVRATASQIKEQALRDGMKTLHDDGLAKVIAGITTVDEVVRVTTRTTQ